MAFYFRTTNLLNISKYYLKANNDSIILAIENKKQLKLKERVKLSFILRSITYILIIGHIGIASFFYTHQITKSDLSFIENKITIENQMILDDFEKEIEDQISTQKTDIVESSLPNSSKRFSSSYLLNSHQGDISTPPPEVLS